MKIVPNRSQQYLKAKEFLYGTDNFLCFPEDENLTNDGVHLGLQGLKEELKKLGLRTKIVKGDGNCYFRAIADQLFGDEDLHYIVRFDVVEYMRKNQGDYEPFIVGDQDPLTVYLRELAKDGTWAGDYELNALCLAYQINLRVLVVEKE